MAVADLIPTIWSARFTFNVRRASTFLNLINRNYEGEIQAAGNTVRIPTYTGDVTVKDYVQGTDIDDAQEPNATTQDLVIDRQKYWNIGVEDIARAQAKPNIMDEHMAQAAYKASRQIDADILAKFSPTGNAIPAGQTVAMDVGSYDTQPNRIEAAKAFIAGLIDVKRQIREADLLFTGWWIVITPRLASILEEYLTMGGNVQLSNTGEAVLTRGMPTGDGSAPAFMLSGFAVWVSNDIKVTTNTAKCFMGTNAAVTHADQITTIEPLRDQKRFRDLIRGLYVYGTRKVEGKFLWCLNITIAAT